MKKLFAIMFILIALIAALFPDIAQGQDDDYFYLSRWHGDGLTEPFEPLVSYYADSYTLIDLRPDSTKVQGFCIVRANQYIDGSNIWLLGQHLDEPITGISRALLNMTFGRDLISTRLNDALYELLYNRLLFGADGHKRLLLGGLIAGYPLSNYGHGTFTDNFNRGDSPDLGSDWVDDILGDFIIDSNACFADAGGDNLAMAQGSGIPASENHYAQAIVNDYQSAGGSGLSVRVENGGQYDNYSAGFEKDSSRWYLGKTINGSFSYIATLSTGYSNPNWNEYYLEADGSSLVFKVDGVVKISDSDSSLASNIGTGINSYNAHWLDDFQASDLYPLVVSEPSGFTANRTGLSEVHFSWDSLLNSDYYEIRGSYENYPSENNSGYAVYTGNLTSYDLFVNLMVPAYFSLWNHYNGDISATHETAKSGGDNVEMTVNFPYAFYLWAGGLFLMLLSFFIKSPFLPIAVFCSMIGVVIEPEFQGTWYQYTAGAIMAWSMWITWVRFNNRDSWGD